MALNDAIPVTRGEIVVIVDRVRLDRVGPAPRSPSPSGWPRSAPRALFGHRDATTHWRTDRVPVEHESVALDAAA